MTAAVTRIKRVAAQRVWKQVVRHHTGEDVGKAGPTALKYKGFLTYGQVRVCVCVCVCVRACSRAAEQRAP